MSKLPAEPKTGLPVPDGWDLEMWKFVKSLQLSGDLRFLLVSRDANGTSLKFNLQALLKEIEQAVSAPAGSSDYNGYFKVVKVDDTKIKVINGINPESSIAGRINAGSLIDVNVAEFTINSDCVVFAEITYNAESNTLTAVLKCQTELPPSPSPPPPTAIFHIADVFLTPNLIIGQVWQGGEYQITDRWL